LKQCAEIAVIAIGSSESGIQVSGVRTALVRDCDSHKLGARGLLGLLLALFVLPPLKVEALHVVVHRNCYDPLCGSLADDVAVELGDDRPRRAPDYLAHVDPLRREETMTFTI
jgi:hypothetical protein